MCIGNNAEPIVLRAGESATVPVKTPHCFWNSSGQPVVFEVEIRPARNFENALRAQFGLVAAGKTNENAVPKNIFEWP